MELEWLQRDRFWRTSELNDRGLDDRAIRRLQDSGELTRLRRGAYVGTRCWGSLDEEARLLQRVYAHQHSVAPRTNGRQVYSHTTAAAVHELKVLGADGAIHVSQDFRPGPRSHGPDVRSHFVRFDPRDIVEVQGLPCTSLERTVVDCALVLPAGPAVVIADQALARGADRATLIAILGKCRGFKGIATARFAVGFADGRSESPGESLTRFKLDLLNIPDPVAQFEVRTRLGLHRLDFAWPELKLALEFDGDAKYLGGQPADRVILGERKRERALQEDGWIFIRIEWKDLYNEGLLKARILRKMVEARRRMAA